jgi:carboxyl-terminal processing protease
MSIRSKLTLISLSAFIALYSIVGGMLSSSNNPLVRAIAETGPYPQLRIFEEVISKINSDYVEKPDLDKVRVGALRGLTDSLDPYSAYLLPTQVKDYQAGKHNSDVTGLVIGQYSGFAYVITVVPNSPAEKVGIRVGDVIEYIDGHATRDLDLYDVKTLLAGQTGTSVELSLINRKTDKIKLTRAVVANAPIETRAIETQIGYVKVPILHKGQAEAVAAAVKDVLKKGAKSILLDLRGSAGGELSEGVTVADYFIKSGTLAKTIGRKEAVLATYDAKADNDLTDLPVAAIVDRTTAGAAEVIAAALLESQRGDVVGERTLFGMGSEQKLFPLDDGSAFLLTIARYASPNGKIFMTEGVTPNVEVKRADLAEVNGDEAETDNKKQPPAPPTPGAAPPPNIVAPKSGDDVMLKKAVEVLTTAKAKKRSA